MLDEANPNGSRRSRILLAEDYFAIADVYGAFLADLGFEVVGPVSSVDRALGVLDTDRVDGAVLDVALRGRIVTPVAERLRELGHPFVFLTGMADLEVLPAHFGTVPTVEKPAGMTELAGALGRVGLVGNRPDADD